MAFIDKNLLTRIRRDSKVIPINCSFKECPAWQGCPQVPYQGQMFGKSQAKVFFLFDGASSEDGSVGMPLMSNAGVYFRRVFIPDFLQVAGGTPYLNVNLVCNALVKPDGTSRPPSSDEIHVCWFNFLELLMKHRPELIMCFGGGVFEILYKRAKNKEELPLPEDHKISKLRGKSYKMAFTEDYKPTILCTYSPAFVLRTPTTGKFLKDDGNHALSILKPELASKYVKDKQGVSIDQINVVESVKETLEFIDFLTRGFPESTPLAFDIETNNLNRAYNNKLLSLQFSYEFGRAFVLPIEHPERNLFKDPRDLIKLVDALQKLFSSSRTRTKISWIVGHGLKFDFGVLYGRFKLLMRGSIPLWDTLLGMHWLDENRKEMSSFFDGGRPYSLKTIGKEIFGFTYKSEHLNAREDGELSSLAFEDFAEYGGSDVILNLHLFHEQLDMAERQKDNPLNKLKRFMRYYYSPATRALAVMECNGLYVPKEHLQYLQGANSPIWNRLEQIEKVELQNCPEVLDFRKKYKSKLTGSGISYAEDVWGDNEEEVLPPFDPNKQLQQELFFAKFLNLAPLKKTAKNKASYDKGFLKHYAEPFVYFEEPVIAEKYAQYYAITDDDEHKPNPLALILEQRELKKLGTTYSSGMEAMLVDPLGDCIDSRIRASFHLHGTTTGRTSSSGPNFQNLPAGKTLHAKEIKNMFQAEPPNRRFPNGTCLIQLDYKTAEVRWAAIFARDQNLIKIFNDAREDLKKACDPESNMTDEEFSQSQLASDLHRRTASLMFGVPPDKVDASMRQASKCVVGSTLIYTNKGILPIESLVEDPCDDNWVQPVRGLRVSSPNGPIDVLCINHKWVDSTIRIETSVGISIQGDRDHSISVWENCQIVEKRLGDISEGDYLLAPRSNNVWSTESPRIDHTIANETVISEGIEAEVTCLICGKRLGNLLTHITHAHGTIDEYRKRFPGAPLVSPAQIVKRMNSLLGSMHNVFVPKCPDKMSSSLAKLLGYLVAEGDGQRYTMSGNAEKSAEMLKDFIFCMSECFGLSTEVLEYPELTTTGIIRVPAKVVRYLLGLGLIKGYSETQRVPEIIFRSTRSEVIAFLSAYFEGYGGVKHNSICAVSASELLLQDIQQLLLNLNIVGTLFSETRVTPVGKELRQYYGIRLGISDAILFRDTVGFISSHKRIQADALSGGGRECIYGLEKLLQELKGMYKVSKGKLHRYAIDGVSVKFGERIVKGGGSEITHNRLDSRPYVLDTLKVWSNKEKNEVYDDISWVHNTRVRLLPVTKKTKINQRVRVYGIEVNDPKHMFVANGLLSKNCITFGIMYGMGVKTLAISNGWTLPEAEDKVKKFFSAFSVLENWLRKAQDVAKKKGFVETLMGRRRRLTHLFDTKDFRNEQKANKLAMNAPIQGQSSDAGIIGLLSFVSYLIKNGLERKWLVQNVVHDSCLIQVPFEDIRTALPIIQHCFVDGMSEYLLKYFDLELPLPIECEIELGLKYGGLIKWDGRPKTLTEIIARLEAQADALWRQPQDTSKFDLLDLVKK